MGTAAPSQNRRVCREQFPGASGARWLRAEPGGSAEGDSPTAASCLKCVLAIGCREETKAASRRGRWDLMAFLSLSRLEKLQGAQAASALRTTSWAFKALSNDEIRRVGAFFF